MQNQTIPILIVVPDREDFSEVEDLLHRIKKWRFKVQWASDLDTASGEANTGNYGIIFIDDHFDRADVSNFLAKLEEEACVTPVVLLISTHERLNEFEEAIAKTDGYLEALGN